MLYDRELEDYVYEEIRKQYHFIDRYSKDFGVDPRLIVGLIFVERIQYKLDAVRFLAHRIKFKFEDFTKIFCNNEDVSEFFNTSKGFSHIKFGTARYLVRKYRDRGGILSDFELGTYPNNIEICIKFSCAIIKEHILMWVEKVPNIRDCIDILATLYNISDFENKIPHGSPLSGGSILPVIIDGQYIKGVCFGDRVKQTCLSEKMDLFFKSLQCSYL